MLDQVGSDVNSPVRLNGFAPCTLDSSERHHFCIQAMRETTHTNIAGIIGASAFECIYSKVHDIWVDDRTVRSDAHYHFGARNQRSTIVAIEDIILRAAEIGD